MPATSLETVNAAKKAHVASFLTKVAEATDILKSEPELWFGGLPPALQQFENLINFQAKQIREHFEMPEPEPETEA